MNAFKATRTSCGTFKYTNVSRGRAKTQFEITQKTKIKTEIEIKP